MKKLCLFLLSVLALSCSKEEKPRELSSKNLISSFILNIDDEQLEGKIDQQENTISFSTEGKDVSSLKPTIEYSENARIAPSPNQAQDFREKVSYTVYAEDGSPNVYRVLVSNRSISSDNEINSLTFEVDGETIQASIDRNTGIVRADVPFTEINDLTPTISLPDHASIDPPLGKALDFTAPVTYTVTAENGDSRTYVVQVNEPKIERVIGRYFPDNQKFYVGAEAGIMGRFLMNEGVNPTVYLFDGSKKYHLENLEYHFSYTDTSSGIDYYAVTFVIPDDTPTNMYTVILEKQGYKVEFGGFDVKFENAPNPQSLSQEIFEREDVLKIYGEHLTDGIIIPSNGSDYILYNYANSSKVKIWVNEDGTEMNFEADYNYHRLYPSYYGREPQEKKITFFDPETSRIGRSIKTMFK
ncbi:hypothetical protein GCM10007103_22110 [Salinimicrobium marinum]|uniref:DUF5018 domain-containing protein n=1 Tax=Salinimicrobium marinum TaxID=680283 RepID=A0A918SI71_9FLAO|nr:DUF5018 domain-containing protein [Salinimicrobium marinum]GHA40237.1 hypothetical protein GCM10007103_22110 [Salinimicrobium marinum]